MKTSFVCISETNYRDPKNGKFVNIPLGKKVSESTYRNYPSDGIRRHFAEVTSTRGWQRWSEDEHMFLAELYYETPVTEDVTPIVGKFLKEFSDRSWGSVHSRVWGIVGLDAQRPEIGLGTWSEEIALTMNSVDPERFPLPAEAEDRLFHKLDYLLSSILG